MDMRTPHAENTPPFQLSDENIRSITQAGWSKTSLLPVASQVYEAVDPHGELAGKLEDLGFQPGSLEGNQSFKINTLPAPNGAINPAAVIISPETKCHLDQLCGKDIAQPYHDRVTNAQIISRKRPLSNWFGPNSAI